MVPTTNHFLVFSFWKSACDFLRRVILSFLQTPQSETMELTFPRWPDSCVLGGIVSLACTHYPVRSYRPDLSLCY
jgi:hypothetical protein